jgi:hypothetical protein
MAESDGDVCVERGGIDGKAGALALNIQRERQFEFEQG